MRVPITGGQPQVVLTGHIYDRPVCARSPANLCAIAEQTPEQKQLIFTAFNPANGRKRELARFDTESASDANYVWDLARDGTRLAVLKYSERPIHTLPLDGQTPHDIAVKGWNSLLSLTWAANGKGLFASGAKPGGSALLHVDFQGNADVLREQRGTVARWYFGLGGPSIPWATPSPDGHHLAIYDWNLNANMWMIENFLKDLSLLCVHNTFRSCYSLGVKQTLTSTLVRWLLSNIVSPELGRPVFSAAQSISSSARSFGSPKNKSAQPI